MPQVEIPIIVPHGRTVASVAADGSPAMLQRTLTQQGFGYDVQYWVADLRRPYPVGVVIYFEPPSA